MKVLLPQNHPRQVKVLNRSRATTKGLRNITLPKTGLQTRVKNIRGTHVNTSTASQATLSEGKVAPFMRLAVT